MNLICVAYTIIRGITTVTNNHCLKNDSTELENFCTSLIDTPKIEILQIGGPHTVWLMNVMCTKTTFDYFLVYVIWNHNKWAVFVDQVYIT
jgi:hypothetical protein